MAFTLANVAGRAALVDAGGGWHDLERVSSGALGPDPMAVLGRPDLHAHAAALAGRTPDGRLDRAAAAGDLGPPVPRPRNVFGIGVNYRSHAEETGIAVPDRPLVFGKFPSCVAGPHDDVELRGDSVDFEAELVVAIGTPGRDIAEADAWRHVAGLTAGQDVSDRRLQFASNPPQFDLGKSFDGYGPIGPVLVSPDSFADPDDLAVACDVSGERRQAARTSDLVFPVAALVAYLSRVVTLAAGDLVFTGTPAGVGMGDGRYLRDGDVVVTTIEGIGTLRNRCAAVPS
jgi:2-keto-4-pentenoate hydratase/2-oxohepta-3-ene-1,7-dioic acid hydratase in catechol pathway